MRKTILTTACVAALSGFTAFGASAQTTGPAAQDSTKTNDTMSKDGMSKDMSKTGSQPKADTMKPDGTKKN